MTSGFFARLSSKLWRILRFPFQLGKQLQALESNAAQTLHKFEQRARDHAQRRRDHDASVSWLQSGYPDTVSAIGKKREQEHFDQLTQAVFAALHREVGTPDDRLGALEGVSAPHIERSAAQEDSRSAGFYLALERRFRATAGPALQALLSGPRDYAVIARKAH